MTNYTLVIAALAATLAVSAAQCDMSDNDCWSKISLSLANQIRSRGGKSALTMGYKSQQSNANAHARDIMNKGYLVHQSLSEATREVGCGLFVNAENIAYHYTQGNIAAKCMDMWEKSAPHLQNIMNSNSDMMSVGFSRRSDGSIWCVMTMTMKMQSNPSGAQCQPVTSGGSGGGGSGGSGGGGGGGNNSMKCAMARSRTPSGLVMLTIKNKKNFAVKLWHKNSNGNVSQIRQIQSGATISVRSSYGASYRLTKLNNDCMRVVKIRQRSGTKKIQIGGHR